MLAHTPQRRSTLPHPTHRGHSYIFTPPLSSFLSVYNLANNIDVQATEARVSDYERTNRASIIAAQARAVGVDGVWCRGFVCGGMWGVLPHHVCINTQWARMVGGRPMQEIMSGGCWEGVFLCLGGGSCPTHPCKAVTRHVAQ